jgi:hypothetical protein
MVLDIPNKRSDGNNIIKVCNFIKKSAHLSNSVLFYIGSFLFGACENALYVSIFSILSLEIANHPKVFSTHNLVSCFGYFMSSIVWLFTVGYKLTLYSFIFAWLGILYITLALLYYRISYPISRAD